MAYLYDASGRVMASFNSSMIFSSKGEYIGCCLGGVVYRIDGEHRTQVGYLKGGRIYRGLMGTASMVGHYDRNGVYVGIGATRKKIASFGGAADFYDDGAAAAVLVCNFNEEEHLEHSKPFSEMRAVLWEFTEVVATFFTNIYLFISGVLQNILRRENLTVLLMLMLAVSVTIYSFNSNARYYVSMFTESGFTFILVLQAVILLAVLIDAIRKRELRRGLYTGVLFFFTIPATYLLYLTCLRTTDIFSITTIFGWFFELLPFMVYSVWIGTICGLVYKRYPNDRAFILPIIAGGLAEIFCLLFVVLSGIEKMESLPTIFTYLFMSFFTAAILNLPGMLIVAMMVETSKTSQLQNNYNNRAPNNISKVFSVIQQIRKPYVKILSQKNLTNENRIKHLYRLIRPLAELNGDYTEGRGIIEEIGDNYVILRVSYDTGKKIGTTTLKLYPDNRCDPIWRSTPQNSFIRYKGNIAIRNFDILTPINHWEFAVENSKITNTITPY